MIDLANRSVAVLDRIGLKCPLILTFRSFKRRLAKTTIVFVVFLSTDTLRPVQTPRSDYYFLTPVSNY